MALVLKDRVKETTTTTGTGSLTLGGAVTGYQSFSSAIGNTNTTYYAIYLDGGSEWEVGIGTVSAGALSRDTVLASSNSGSLVNFSAGQKSVWCDYPAGKAVYTDASGSISEPIVNISDVTGHISSPDYIEFDTAYATALGTGQLGWDGNNTLGLGMIGGNVIQKIGEDQFFYCKATSAITKGQVVMFTGSVGASGVPTGAPATGITDGTYIMGVAAESIALNGFGLVQNFGTLKNINTSTFADGDILWYDPSVTGGLTKTKPSAPNVKAQIAAVINGGSSGGGTILIRINPGSTLGGTDSNAQITSPTAAQIITYDSTDQYWKNTSLASGTGISTSTNANGTLTVTNTAPDQTVALTGGTGISTSGTYPNFTITNTAPDQTVSLTAGTGISTSGTYPNFTITNTSPSSGGTVTSVSGTSPISVATGTTTPAISISQATTSTNGYLSSTDWNTFNNKGSGTVTSITAGTGLSGGTITTSGTVALANTAVTAGSYTNASITVDAQGRLTSASSGSASGDVVGPASVTDNAIARFDGTTGKLIQDSAVTIADTNGSMTFGGTGTRIIADMSNATYANRLMFQGSTANTQSSLGILPNGTSATASYVAYNNSDLTNAQKLIVGVDASVCKIFSTYNGSTSSSLPISFQFGSSTEALRITTNGGVSFGSSGTAYGTSGQVLQSNGDAPPSWTTLSSMVYPSAGIAVSTGSAWGTSLTAPSGTIVGTTDTQTLTNKRVTPRVSTTTSSAAPTINTDNVDIYGLTAQAVNITSFTTNLSGTPTNGQKLQIYIVGTAARTITWGASFESSTVALPTTTVTTNRLDVGFIWNAATSKWRCIAVA